MGGPVQLDVEPERQGSDAAHGRVHGGRGEVHGGRHVRLRATPQQAPLRNGLPHPLRPLHSSPSLGPLVSSHPLLHSSSSRFAKLIFALLIGAFLLLSL